MAIKSLTRRETLQGIGMIGVGALVSACGGSSNGGASPTASPSPFRSATGTAVPTRTATGVASGTPTPTTAGSSPTPTRTSTAGATATQTTAPSASPTGSATSAASATDSPTPTGTPTDAPSGTPTSSEATPTVTPDSISCILSPEQTEGPYFLNLDLLRSDIREDRAGALLTLNFVLVDAEGCTPIRDALVYLWHADAAGVYSGFSGQLGGVNTTGQTFLRGYQVTDANGRVQFTTIYPGWYPGRTVHMHVKIYLNATTLLTSQLYFDDSLTDLVYQQAPYNTRGARNTRNGMDGIITSGGASLSDVILDVVSNGDGYAATMVFGVAQ